MTFRLRLAGALLVLGLASCSTLKTSTNYDPNAVQEISSYHTYSWLPVKEGADPNVYNPIIQARVEGAVDHDLQSRGYKKVDPSEQSDFKIGWHGAINHKVDVDYVNSYYGYGWDPWYDPFYGPVAYGGTGVTTPVVREYRQGTLILDIVDTASNKLVWRGTAQAELSEKTDANKSQKLINQAVNEMLGKFPPEPKKQ
ncbi:DUF4136 domain-containing protein [Vitiosangium sp. GDMCC 1.1324]|uniref:DUF4136 domain-containing protein n=1 Tax=Vitiosangium sp. (strain GDMCC 1.1324) TaxID=2138576 RepID=UPI000D3CD89C|nr:DUF4136 domain-containing protein [Vitiosangium sp. GDMCC 1.1324]PTL77720.1 DUF4136 domain-containing protein [Vitiosangium sp. GDMCC 1.1324]